MSDHAGQAPEDAGKPGGNGRTGRAGRWWLALIVVCAVGLLVFGGLLFIGRPRPGHDPIADPAAAGKGSVSPGGAAASAAMPSLGVSPTPEQAGLTSAPPPVPAPAPSRQLSPPPRPSPSVTSGPLPYLTLNPASGVATLTPPPTWSSSACPSGFQGSAQLSEYTLSGTFLSSISNVVAAVTSPFSGQLQGSVGALLGFGGITASNPGTLRWVVGCYSGIGGTGAQKLGQSVYVTLLATGSYKTSGTPPG